MGTGSNLVIQQAGDVSRLQEAMQKTAELQQLSATQDAQREDQLRRSQVQKSTNSATGNKVNKDGKQDGAPQQHSQQRKRKTDGEDDGKGAGSGTGGLLDVIV